MITARNLISIPIHGYRWTIGAIVPKSCRFEPSCSRYAIDAIHRHGPIPGIWLAIKRIARCHPWGECGYDPVPNCQADETSTKTT